LVSLNRLSTNPVVCLSAMPKSTFIVRQVRIAFFGKTVLQTVF